MRRVLEDAPLRVWCYDGTMQAVILAAGRGTRMGELTEGTPKVMLEVAGKPVLEHKLDALPESIDDVIIVVGYLGGVIQRYFGGEFNGRRISYVQQDNPVGGTADALRCARELLSDKFLVMNGDDLYAREDLEKCLEGEWAILVQKRNPLLSGGKVTSNKKGEVTRIEEGSHEGPGCVNAGVYVLDARFFDTPPVPKAPGSSEYGLPQTILVSAKTLGVSFKAVPATFWIQITAPEDLQKAEEILAQS